MIDCGVMKDKDWRSFVKLWEKMQKGMIRMTSPISYVQLKEDIKRTREKALEAAK